MNFLLLAASVMLAWDANTDPVQGYKLRVGIEPLTPGGTPVQTLDVGNVTQYQVDGLDFGTTYFFVATAYSYDGESGYSNEISYMPVAPVEDKIRYWPRANANGAMNRGRFEAAQSKDGPWTILGWSKWYPSYAGEEMVFPAGTFAQYKAFRYVGYQYGTVAEIEFIQSGEKITGIVFGTPGSWGNHGATVDKAFDGDVSTYWDAPDWSWTDGNYCGIERP